jgi:hypothetical protein
MNIQIMGDWPRKIRTDDPQNHKVVRDTYGWSITPNHKEWEMSFKWTSRQDGNTAWGVILAEVDGDVTCITGLNPWKDADDAMVRAAGVLTRNWIEPIGGF